MQNMNILLAQSKTNFLNEAIKVKPEDNMRKSGNLGSPSFIDLLFADQMEASNISDIEKGFTGQTSHDLPTITESQKSGDSDIPDFSETKQPSINDNNYDKQDNNKNEENLDITANSDKELKTETIQEDYGLKSHQDISNGKSIANSKHEEVSDKVNKEDRDIKSEFITSFENLLSQEGIKQQNPRLFVMLKKVLSVMQGIETNNKKSDFIKNLRELLSRDVNSYKDQELIAKLNTLLSVIEKNGVEADAVKKLRKLLSQDVNNHKDHELIAKLETILPVIEKNGVEADAVKKLRKLLSQDVNNHKDHELIAKLETILPVIEGKDVKTDITAKLKKLLSQEGLENKNKELLTMLEKTIKELKNREKNIKSEKSGEKDADKSFLKGIVEKSDENKHEKVINKEKNIEKRHIDKVFNDLNSIKISEKGKESIDRSSKYKKDLTLENETSIESRLSKKGNNVDTSNSDREIKVEQRVAISQSTNNSLTDQHQNKNKFAQQSNNGKSDNSKSQRTEADHQIVSDKTQNIFKPETTSQVSKTSIPTRTISQSQLGDMVVRGARQFQKGGNSEIHLTIKKPDLGNIKVSFIENRNGRLEVVIMAERPEASDLIKQNSAEIKQLLLQEGIDLSKFDVFDQYNRNKRYLAQGNGFQKNYRRNRSIEGDESTRSNETLVQNDDLSVQDIGTVSSNEKVNVFA